MQAEVERAAVAVVQRERELEKMTAAAVQPESESISTITVQAEEAEPAGSDQHQVDMIARKLVEEENLKNIAAAAERLAEAKKVEEQQHRASQRKQKNAPAPTVRMGYLTREGLRRLEEQRSVMYLHTHIYFTLQQLSLVYTAYNSQDRSLQEQDAASQEPESDITAAFVKKKRRFIQKTSTSGLPLNVFDTLGRLKAYPDNEIKVALQKIRICFGAIEINHGLMKCLKNAISMCSTFLVFFFSPATIPASADAGSMAVARTADRSQNDNDEGILLNIYFKIC